mgnify:CR=1 FL=1
MSFPSLSSMEGQPQGLSPAKRQRPGFRNAPLKNWDGLDAVALGPDAVALGLWAAALALVGLACLLVPQRISQRPANRGVMTVQVNRNGALRIWNQPIANGSLQDLLQRAERRSPGVHIRLVPDPDVPWGMVQSLVERLEAPQRNLELQLP